MRSIKFYRFYWVFFLDALRTKFSLDTNPVGRGLESDIHLRIRTMSLDLSSPSHIPLSARIAEFSEDPQNMDQMKEFIDGILNDAEIEANKQLDEKAKVSGFCCFSCNRPILYKSILFCFIFFDIFSRLSRRKMEKVMPNLLIAVKFAWSKMILIISTDDLFSYSCFIDKRVKEGPYGNTRANNHRPYVRYNLQLYTTIGRSTTWARSNGTVIFIDG